MILCFARSGNPPPKIHFWPLFDWYYNITVGIDTANIVTKSDFNALSIDSGPVVAVLLFMKRGSLLYYMSLFFFDDV